MAEPFELQIDGVAYGGKGVGRRDGKVWFVVDGVPGDTLLVKAVLEKKRFGEAEIVEVIKGSALRTPAPCPHFDDCGGCQWQDISYDVQLEWKRSLVVNALERIGQIHTEFPCEIVGNENPFGYRSRFTFQAALDERGQWEIGFYRPRSHELIDVVDCAVAHPLLNQMIKEIRCCAFAPAQKVRLRLECQIVRGAGEKIIVVLHTKTKADRASVAELPAKLARDCASIHEVAFAEDGAANQFFVYDHHFGLTFYTALSQFQQANLHLNRSVRDFVRQVVEKRKHRRILDVFCGSGNLSLALSKSCDHVEGIEFNPVAIEAARYGVRQNGITNASYFAGDAEEHLWKIVRCAETFDCVVVDPPREGMYRAMVPLNKLQPSTIIYLSCNPTTLARDLGYLFREGQYRLDQLRVYDFFPHTYHVESLAVLSRMS